MPLPVLVAIVCLAGRSAPPAPVGPGLLEPAGRQARLLAEASPLERSADRAALAEERDQLLATMPGLGSSVALVIIGSVAVIGGAAAAFGLVVFALLGNSAAAAVGHILGWTVGLGGIAAIVIGAVRLGLRNRALARVAELDRALAAPDGLPPPPDASRPGTGPLITLARF